MFGLGIILQVGADRHLVAPGQGLGQEVDVGLRAPAGFGQVEVGDLQDPHGYSSPSAALPDTTRNPARPKEICRGK